MAALKREKYATLTAKLAALPSSEQTRVLKKINNLVENFNMSEQDAYVKVLGTGYNKGGVSVKKGIKNGKTKKA